MSEQVEIRFRNWYFHCGQKWTSDWNSMCNDECRVCKTSDIAPFFSIEIEQTEDAWEDKYKPIQFGEEDDPWNGQFIDTTDDLSAIQDPAVQDRVWTLVECEGSQIITAGYHFVNRMGYFLTENPWVEGEPTDYYVEAEPPFEYEEADGS